jgi:hypothetical protein
MWQAIKVEWTNFSGRLPTRVINGNGARVLFIFNPFTNFPGKMWILWNKIII